MINFPVLYLDWNTVETQIPPNLQIIPKTVHFIVKRAKVKPVYKGQWREPENVLFIYRFKLCTVELALKSTSI